MRKIIAISALCSLVVATAVWLWWSQRSEAPRHVAGEAAVVRIAATKSFVSAPVWLAAIRGFYRDVGVEVVLLECETGLEALAAMLRDEADFATAADVPIIMKLFEQPDFAIVTTLATTDVIARIIARTDTGIVQAADLRGKTIATAKGTASHFTLSSALLRDGLALTDVEIVEAKPTAMLEMRGDHKVDAVAVWEPYASRAQEMLRDEAVVLPDSGLYRASFNLVVRSAFAVQHPAIVQRVLQALNTTIAFMHTHNAEAYQIVSEWLKPFAIMTDKGGKEQTYGLMLDQTLIVTLGDIARWATRHHLVESAHRPNILQHIYVDALVAINPDAVTIIR